MLLNFQLLVKGVRELKRAKDFKGILLKLERLKQNKMQKEVCYGLCVVSYLSKIENGYANPDENLIKKLFERLDINYCTDEEVINKCSKLIKKYYYELEYSLPRTVYNELINYEDKLKFSPLALDFYIVQAMENHQEIISLLDEFIECMNDVQLTRYYIIPRNDDIKKKLERCKKAYQLNNRSFLLSSIMWLYIESGDYTKVNDLSNKCIQLALEEGNTKVIASCYLCQGTVYACLNIDDLMMNYYKRAIRLLQNTGWKNECSEIYYNIGAVYLSLNKYDDAMEYLNRVSYDDFLVNHKKALVKIRSGKIDEAQIFLNNMKKMYKDDIVKEYMYREAVMESKDGYLENPEYIEVLEKLLDLFKKKKHFGYTFFYKDILKGAYCRQRKYRKALEVEDEISLKYQKVAF